MVEVIATTAASTAGLSIARMCRALALNRTEFYRRCAAVDGQHSDTALRDQLQRIALEMPAYGYRRMTHE
jgi:hypothetical protein